MKIKQILGESATDLVAHYFVDADKRLDTLYNPEAARIASDNEQYYADYFTTFYETGQPPVFTKCDNHVDNDAVEWNNEPLDQDRPSAGHHGKTVMLKRIQRN